MSTLNDAITAICGDNNSGLREYYLANGGTGGTLGDCELQMLLAKTGLLTGTIPDLWLTLLTTLGFISGTLNDRLLAFWLAGGVLPP